MPGAPPERLELRIYPSRADVYLDGVVIEREGHKYVVRVEQDGVFAYLDDKR